jgi:hypothetical protein
LTVPRADLNSVIFNIVGSEGDLELGAGITHNLTTGEQNVLGTS